MKKYAISILLLIALCPGAFAQDNITAVTYQVSIPQGDFSDYVDETSWIGWGIEGRRFRDPSSPFTVGFAFAWHVFDQRATGTTEIESGAVTGTQRRYVPDVQGEFVSIGRGQAMAWMGLVQLIGRDAQCLKHAILARHLVSIGLDPARWFAGVS